MYIFDLYCKYVYIVCMPVTVVYVILWQSAYSIRLYKIKGSTFKKNNICSFLEKCIGKWMMAVSVGYSNSNISSTFGWFAIKFGLFTVNRFYRLWIPWLLNREGDRILFGSSIHNEWQLVVPPSQYLWTGGFSY